LTNRIVTVMPGPTTPSVRGEPPTSGVLQDVLEDDDPRLDLALLVLGRVVPAVLAQVPFLPGCFPRLSSAGERSRRSCLPRSAYHQVEDERAG
jgi:hypothetical protein